MNIEVLNVSLNERVTRNGKGYTELEVAFKNKSFQDKVEAKKLNNMFGKDVFKVLSTAKSGEQFTVSRVKNNEGFWDWTGIGPMGSNSSSDASRATQTAAPYISASKGTPSPNDPRETREERAERQVLIVRQSSIASAVSASTLLKLKSGEDIISLAKQFEAYVFGKDNSSVLEDNSMPSGFEDMADDIPY